MEISHFSVEDEQQPAQSYDQLNHVLGIPNTLEEADTWSSVGAYIYARNLFTLVDPHLIDAISGDNEDELRKYLTLNTATALISFDQICLSEGYDLVENSNALRELTPAQKRSFSLRMAEEVEKRIIDPSDTTGNLLNGSFAAVAAVYASNRRVLDEASLDSSDQYLYAAELTDEQVRAINDLKEFHYQTLYSNPARFRRNTSRALHALRNPITREFVDTEVRQFEVLEQGEADSLQTMPEQPPIEDQEGVFFGQEVDFTILPAGTNVREYTERLVAGLSAKERENIDLKRVGVLEALREQLGADRTYYVHGVPNHDSETGVRKDYIGLVIQTHDRTGRVISEDAIAVSPLERRNAGYVFRQDYSIHTSWRETLSQRKDVARVNGARPLKFTEVEGRDKYEAYVDKALELLTCPAGQFGPDYDLYFQKSSGEYILRKKRVIRVGAKAVQAAQL